MKSSGRSWLRAAKMMQKIRRRCPWTQAQTFATLKKYLAEESNEALAALAAVERNPDHLCEELGDLFYEILFLGGVAEERGLFTVEDIGSRLCQKLKRRHPHVFGFTHQGLRRAIPASLRKPKNVSEIAQLWERIKKFEKRRSRE